MRASRWWLLSWCVVASACKPATQVIFEIETDIACDNQDTGYLALGLVGQAENAPPVGDPIARCSADGKRLGEIVAVKGHPEKLEVSRSYSGLFKGM